MRFPLKVVLVTAFLTMLPTVVAAQANVGFRGGLSLASIGGDDVVEGLDSRTGLNIGGFVNVPLSDVVGLQFGAGFVQKGFEETEAGVKVELGVDYLELPLLLTLSPPTTGNVGFNFFFGPAVAFKTSCNLSGSEGGVEVSFDCDDPDFEVDLKTVDFGAMVGAGLDIGVTDNISVVVEGFYNLGLTKIDDSGADDNVKNRAFSFLAGLSFSVGTARVASR